MFVSIDKENNKALFSTPGLNSENGIKFATDGGVRNMYVSRLTYNMHVVVGSSIYQVDKARNSIFGIDLTTSEGYVGIDDINTQIMFVDGSKGYIFDKSTDSYSEITHSSFPPLPKDVIAFGDRFYVIKGDTNEIYFSEIKRHCRT